MEAQTSRTLGGSLSRAPFHGVHYSTSTYPHQKHNRSDAKPQVKVAPTPVPSRPTWLSDHDSMPSFSPVIERQPRRVGSTRYILYLYSGHRREGDMIEWAHTLGAQRHMAVEVISLDIVYDAKLWWYAGSAIACCVDRLRSQWLLPWGGGGAPLWNVQCCSDACSHRTRWWASATTFSGWALGPFDLDFEAAAASLGVQRFDAGMADVFHHGLQHWHCSVDGASCRVEQASRGSKHLANSRASHDWPDAERQAPLGDSGPLWSGFSKTHHFCCMPLAACHQDPQGLGWPCCQCEILDSFGGQERRRHMEDGAREGLSEPT